MKIRDRHRYAACMLVLVALALRAGIPAGYMPAAAGSGLLFELCPAGMPAAVMHSLSGHHHGQHSPGPGNTGHFDVEQCPIGLVLSAATVSHDFPTIATNPPAQPIFLPARFVAFSSKDPSAYRSRGPPA